jgi:hypothetical protein
MDGWTLTVKLGIEHLAVLLVETVASRKEG